MVAYALPAVFAACLVLATLPQLLAEPYPRIVTGQTVDVGSNVRLGGRMMYNARVGYILFFCQQQAAAAFTPSSAAAPPLSRRC